MYSTAVKQVITSLRSRPTVPNSFEQSAEILCVDWAREFRLGSSQLELNQIARIRCGSCAAYAYPHASDEVVGFGAKVIAWLFLFDDLYGEGENSRDMREMIEMFASFEAVIRTGFLPDEPTNFHLALADLRREGLRISANNDVWSNRFASSLRNYFDGCLLEFEFRHFGAFPSLEAYRRIRAWSVGLAPVFSVMELGMSRVLRDQEYTGKSVIAVQERAYLLSAWVNDIYSFAKESNAGDRLNLIAVLANESNLNVEKSLQLAVSIYDDDLLRFEKESSEVASQSTAIREYVEGLDDWVQGHIDWVQLCGRYTLNIE
jgi:Terpene synthase family 2, C-terminal metal binding